MKVFLSAILFVGLCVLGLGVNIFFRKGGRFPDTEISSNPAMRRLGIKCVKEEEMELHGTGTGKDACGGNRSDACSSCALYNIDR